jgi:hypothetical protein
MSSLISLLAAMGLFIEVQGPDASLPGYEYVSGDVPTRVSLYDRGVALAGEDDLSLELISIPIRVGQCWSLRPKVFEIVAVSGESVEC